MNDKIASLEAKLRNMEALASKHAQDQTASEQDESEEHKTSTKQNRKDFQKTTLVSGWTRRWSQESSTATRRARP